MALIHQSLFTAADGTNPATLTPAVGNQLVTTSGVWTVASNRICREGSLQFNRIRTNQTLPNDYTVRVVVRDFGAQSDEAYRVELRYVDGSNFYIGAIGRSAIEIAQFVSGSFTLLGTYAWTPTTGVDYDIRFPVSGSSLAAWLGTSQVIAPATASGLSSGGHVTLWHEGTSGNSTTGWHTDTLEIDDTIYSGGGGGGSTTRRGRMVRSAERRRPAPLARQRRHHHQTFLSAATLIEAAPVDSTPRRFNPTMGAPTAFTPTLGAPVRFNPTFTP